MRLETFGWDSFVLTEELKLETIHHCRFLETVVIVSL
jgi:hypothetical protein